MQVCSFMQNCYHLVVTKKMQFLGITEFGPIWYHLQQENVISSLAETLCVLLFSIQPNYSIWLG